MWRAYPGTIAVAAIGATVLEQLSQEAAALGLDGATPTIVMHSDRLQLRLNNAGAVLP
jgi:hypothetical protein